MKNRSYTLELLDADNIPTPDLYRNLAELDLINRFLGGYKASRKGLEMLFQRKNDIKTVLDVGFGGGDFMKDLHFFAQKKGRNITFYGVDLKRDCVEYAAKNLQSLENVQLICSDYRDISPELMAKIEVVHCSLFIHHLRDEEIIGLFQFCKQHNCMLLVNDLHRHFLAYWSIKILTFLFSKSYLVKNDAPLSVLRAFRRNELVDLLQKAGFTDFEVKWSWAFRFILVGIQ